MKLRRLSGLAAGLLLSAANAQTQTNLQFFGVVDAYAGSKQLASATGAKTTNVDGGGMTTSHWGFKGAEDLGGAVSAVFELSGFIRNDVGDTGRYAGDPVFARTAMVGLRGAWGELRLGRQTTPNFISTIRLNPFADSAVFAPVLLHTYLGGQPLEAAIVSGGASSVSDSSFINAIGYTSPNVGGLSGALMYSLGETTTGNANNRRVGYSLTYAQGGPLMVSLSGERVDRPSLPLPPVVAAGNQKQKQATDQLGVSYDFGIAKLFAQHSRTRIDLPSSALRQFRTNQLGTSVPLGAGRLLLSGAVTGKNETALSDVRRTTWSLGYDHDLSKRTDVYAVLMRDRVSNLQDGTTIAVGVRHRF